jgi:glycosyltransferase involved in cell wall biosynthesis
LATSADRRPLVVHLIDELPPDGAERLLVDILRYQNPHFRYAVGCVVRGGILEGELRELGVEVVVFGRRGRFDPTLLFRLASWFRRNRAAVVHTHLFTADTYGRIAARLAGVPAVFCTVHNIVNPWKSIVHKTIDWTLARLSTRVIGCSDEVAQTLVQRDHLPPKRIAAIRNGIDLRRFESISGTGVREEFGVTADQVLIGIVGRLHPQKAHQDLFAALARLDGATLDKLVCLVIGDGDLRQTLEAEVRRLNLTGRVVFTGLRRDVPRLMNALDLFVMSSHWEGLPIAMLEAMACAVPPLSTAVGGVPDVIEDGVNGVLVKAGDVPALTVQIQRLVADADLRSRLGAKAKEDVLRRYDVVRTAEAYDALYCAALGLEPAHSLAGSSLPPTSA